MNEFFIDLEHITVKLLAKEDTLLRTHCCRHKCFPVCPRAQHICCGHKFCVRDTKNVSEFVQNILCPQQMFPSLRSPRNIMSNNVSSFASTLSPVYLKGWRIFKMMTAVVLGPKNPFKNSYSRKSRIVNAVVIWSPAGQIDWPKSVFLQDKVMLFETMMTTMNEVNRDITKVPD